MNNYVDFQELNKKKNMHISHYNQFTPDTEFTKKQSICIPRMSNNISNSFMNRNLNFTYHNTLNRNVDIMDQFNMDSKIQLDKYNNELPQNMKSGFKKEEINKRLGNFELKPTQTKGIPFIKQNIYLDMKPENTSYIYE